MLNILSDWILYLYCNPWELLKEGKYSCGLMCPRAEHRNCVTAIFCQEQIWRVTVKKWLTFVKHSTPYLYIWVFFDPLTS